MGKALLRSVLMGLATAIILLIAVPSLRSSVINLPKPLIEETIGDLQLSFSHGVRRAGPAVVNIYSRQYVEEDKLQLKTQGLGSGVIVSDKGYIITNYHVIAESDQIIVALQDGRYSAATLIGKDRRTDIAILKVEIDNLGRLTCRV